VLLVECLEEDSRVDKFNNSLFVSPAILHKKNFFFENRIVE
jgi:hypothetical protein